MFSKKKHKSFFCIHTINFALGLQCSHCNLIKNPHSILQHLGNLALVNKDFCQKNTKPALFWILRKGISSVRKKEKEGEGEGEEEEEEEEEEEI